jgi:L-amino acid N-acyltransferase YncA
VERFLGSDCSVPTIRFPVPPRLQRSITYFMRPEQTGKGVGSLMLEYLVEEAKKKGISSILASISSLNETSLRFHQKHGFGECDRFRQVGKKKGKFFDVIWMQKML